MLFNLKTRVTKLYACDVACHALSLMDPTPESINLTTLGLLLYAIHSYDYDSSIFFLLLQTLYLTTYLKCYV